MGHGVLEPVALPYSRLAIAKLIDECGSRIVDSLAIDNRIGSHQSTIHNQSGDCQSRIRQWLLSPEPSRELADVEPSHLMFEGGEGDPEVPRGGGDVPIQFVERLQDVAALESGHGLLEE